MKRDRRKQTPKLVYQLREQEIRIELAGLEAKGSYVRYKADEEGTYESKRFKGWKEAEINYKGN